MSQEEEIKINQWAKEKSLPANVVVKLLLGKGVEVRSPYSSVSKSVLDSIEKDAEAEKQKIDAKAAAKKATETPKVSSSSQETSSSAPRTLKGKFSVTLKKGPNSTTRTVKAEPKKVTEKPAATKVQAKEQVLPKAPVSPLKTDNVSKNTEPKPLEKVTEKSQVVQNLAFKQETVKPAKPVSEKVQKKTSEEQKPVRQMLSNTDLKAPVMKAKVFEPDAAILARIQKSQKQNNNSHNNHNHIRKPNNKNSNQQGYTGSFGHTNSSSTNNNNNNNNNKRNNNRPYNNNGFQKNNRNNNFTSGSMQAAFGSARGDGMPVMMPQNANNGGRNDKGRHGKNDKDNRNKNNKDRMQENEQQEVVRQNVSRVMASLSKNPVKKVYHKDHSTSETGEEKKILKTSNFITVGELAGLMNQMPARVIAKCMEMGMMVTINARLDFDTIQVLADEFGFEAKLMEEYEDEALGVAEEKEEDLKPRSPVVTVMGHVDHGKTSLLDWIRKSHVVSGESGGITQHIGAYEVTTPVGKVTFLDTPGHEAFSAMRARGSQVTDVIVLVVAADSMVMPQTVECIELAKREKVPLVVAITKIDLPTANPDKIRTQLAERGVEVEQWGGQTSCIEVSARTGQGMNELLETLALETEVLELKANPNAKARGAVVESKLDAGKGSMATILIKNGTLHVGDSFVCGIYSGRVRAMLDERGQARKEAGPSIPCQVLGFDGTPQAGDDLIVVEDEKTAREIASKRRMAARERDLRARQTISLESMQNGVKEGKISELNLIVKADVGGSAEALAASLEKLSNREVKVNIIRKGVGAITDSDVLFATTAKAVIVAFHLMPSATVREMAAKDGIEIRTYRVIYDCIEDIKNVVEGLLKPRTQEEIVGEAEIRQLFKIPKAGTIAGCMVTVGEVNRNSYVHVYRNGVELGKTEVLSLKRLKDDVKSVARGFECGINLKGYDNIQVGDTLVFFKEVQIARTLADVAREEAEALKAEAAKKEAET